MNISFNNNDCKKMTKEVEKYFSNLPVERKIIVMNLHNFIMGLFPHAKIDMSYKMPTYKFKDGWVAIANQKSYVSLYTCGAQHLREFKKKHPEIKTGKGCINLKVTDTLPIFDIKQVIERAIQHPK